MCTQSTDHYCSASFRLPDCWLLKRCTAVVFKCSEIYNVFYVLTQTSVLHMSSLFHAIILCQVSVTYISSLYRWHGKMQIGDIVATSWLFIWCVVVQLWTMYCESHAAQQTPDSESFLASHATVMDFWGRVTPGILQLLSHSKVVSDCTLN